jgi:hypothetical protein
MTELDIIKYIHEVGFDTDGKLGCLIQETIQSLSDEGIKNVALELSSIYPKDEFAHNMKRVNHIPTSLVLRTVFGPLTRNGVLLEYTHPDRKDGLKHNIDLTKNTSWQKSFLFIKYLEDHFIKQNNNYGLLILYEMLGHRYGDLAVLSEGNERSSNVTLMEKAYIDSFNKANEIKCMKQLFSPWYWGALYFTKLGMQDKAVEWHKQHLEMAKQYMHDGRGSYIDKLSMSFKMLKKLMSRSEYDGFVRHLKSTSKENKYYCKVFARGRIL